MSSDSESQLFITQEVLAHWGTEIELSKSNFEFSFVCRQRAVDIFNFRTEDLLTDLFCSLQINMIPGEGHYLTVTAKQI